MQEEVDALQIANIIINSFQNVKESIEKAEQEIEYSSREFSDIAHALELTDFNASSGFKLAKYLKENQMKRRKAKDIKEQLEPLYELMNRYQNLFKEMRNVHAKIEQIRGTQLKRRYLPRERADLFEQLGNGQISNHS